MVVQKVVNGAPPEGEGYCVHVSGCVTNLESVAFKVGVVLAADGLRSHPQVTDKSKGKESRVNCIRVISPMGSCTQIALNALGFSDKMPAGLQTFMAGPSKSSRRCSNPTTEAGELQTTMTTKVQKKATRVFATQH
jgi:hypothetical protein